MQEAETLVAMGGAIKALGGGRVAGYLIRFGTVDLLGDYFTPETYFGREDGDGADTLVHHGFPLAPGLEHLAERMLAPLKTRRDDIGIFAETVLNLADEYERKLYELVQAGKLSWSSGSVAHRVRRESDGKIINWPIAEGSLTPTPADWRNKIVPVKALLGHRPHTVGTIGSIGTRRSTGGNGEIGNGHRTHTVKGGFRMSETAMMSVEEQLHTLSEQVTRLLKYAQDAPAIRNAGVISPDGGTADRNVKTFGDFLTAISRGDARRLREVYGSAKALEEATGASGGYIVPQQFVERLMQVAAERAVVRSRAFVLPMSSKDASIPAVDYSGDYAAGSSTFLGGMQMQWTAEGATVQETEPKLRKLQLVAHKMSGKVPVSNELLADNAAGLEALLVRLFGYAVAFTEDYAFLMGDGAGKPLGVLNAAATITTATALTAAAPTVAELSTMYKRLMPSSRGTAVWVVNTLLSDALMAMNSTGANVLTYLPNLQGRIEPRLFGLPVLETEKMPSTFADGGMLLADFQQYVIGSRQQIEIAMSEHVNFDTDETVWRCTARVEGQPWLNAPIKIGSGGNDTVSAFVKSK